MIGYRHPKYTGSLHTSQKWRDRLTVMWYKVYNCEQIRQLSRDRQCLCLSVVLDNIILTTAAKAASK